MAGFKRKLFGNPNLAHGISILLQR
jgi:hypothetical protein